MANLQITCISKTNRPSAHEAISHVGGTWGRKTQQQTIVEIEGRINQFCTSVNGRSVWLVVGVSQWGNKYLKTEADGAGQNNLLSLPECR